MYSTIYRHAKRLFSPAERGKQRLERELEHTQWLSRSELESWQLARIQRLLKYSYEHVPFYRERYRREGIQPEDIKSLADFRALPSLTREDVNNHLDELVSSDFGGHLHRGKTGGSTGQPMRFYYEDAWNHWDSAYRRRGRGWYSVRDGDKEAWIWGTGRDPATWSRKQRFKARLRRRRYANARNMSEARMQEFAAMLVRWQPTMFRAYPSALALFADFVKVQRISGIRPRLVETTAETLTAPQRQLLEEVFPCPVINYYSSRELGTIAYPCEMGGLHVCETRYLELLADNKPAAPGHVGEIVLTSLHQYAMPLIRYKIGDLAVYEPDSCLCKRGMPVLREIVGRTNDAVVTADGLWVHSGFFSSRFLERPQIIRYQVYQPDRQHLEVRLVCKHRANNTWSEELRSEIQAHFGQSMKIDIQLVDHIELTPAGKHRFIVSDVTHDAGSV